MKDRRIGKFAVSMDLIANDPAMVRKIMNGIIVIRAELIGYMRAFEYVGISDQFDEIDEVVGPPNYAARLRT